MLPSSRTPRGIATISGSSFDSNQTGDPQLAQKQRNPRPESNSETLPDAVTAISDLFAIAHVAGDVPENLVQFRQ